MRVVLCEHAVFLRGTSFDRSCGFAMLQRMINRKFIPYTLKNMYYQTPDRPRMGQLLVIETHHSEASGPLVGRVSHW